jgi:hypothetical protein
MRRFPNGDGIASLNKEKPMTLRALIAGATGLIGSNLAEHLSLPSRR